MMILYDFLTSYSGTKGGYLYTLKNYIGYIDPTIGQAILSAGHIMQELGKTATQKHL
jgi:hypothetical protein